MKQTSFKENILSFSRTVVLSSVTIFALYSVSAWTGPIDIPPSGNVSGPLTLSAVDQVKLGGLGVSNLVAAGTIVANGGLRLVPGAGAGKVLVSDASGVASWQTDPTSQLSGAKASGMFLYLCPNISCAATGCASSGCSGQVTVFSSCSTQAPDSGGGDAGPTPGPTTSHNCIPVGDVLVNSVDFKLFSNISCGPVIAPSNSGSCSPYGDTALGYCVKAGYTSVSTQVISHVAGDVINGMGMNANGTNYATTWGGGNAITSITCGR